MNIIAIDIGNTRVAVGACTGGKVVAAERLDADRAADLVSGAIGRLRDKLEQWPPPRVIVASVNPPMTAAVVNAVQSVVDWPTLLVGRDIELPIPLEVDEPARVGVDRVLAAAAAFNAVGGPVVVANFGTALTINIVGADGKFLGGVICPGMRIGARILHEATAQLPEVELADSRSPFGKNTTQSIQAGLFLAAGGTVREVVERVATELGQWPHLVFSGGDAELVAPAYEFVDSVVPDLVLLGINYAFHKHVETYGKR